jgi:FdhD protein
MADRSLRRAGVLKYEEAAGERVEDQLAAEEPLEIRIGGVPLTVVMRTPGHEREQVIGFLYGEGVIKRAADVVAVNFPANGEHPDQKNIVDIQLAPSAPGVDRRWQRNFLSASSCGLCGVSTIEAIHTSVPPLAEDDLVVDASVVYGLDAQLRNEQAIFARTGGLHAAGLFTSEGAPVVVREDIGRHNAVDKVIGHAVDGGLLPLSRHILMVSGRSSFEIVQKALQAGIPVLAAVSAPSSLARDLAATSNQTLIGFLRGHRLNVYTGRHRIRA